VISGTDKSHWLTSTDQSHDAAVRAPGVRRGLTHPLRLLAVGVVLAFVVWNLFRAPTTEVEGLAGDLDAATATTPTSASTADSGAADAAVDEGGSTSTTVDPDQSTVDVSDLDSALTRYHVFAQHSGRLLRVDLADGQVDVYDVTGRMVGDFAGLLYLVDPRNAIVTLPVDDLDAEPSPNASPVPEGHSLAAVELTGDGLLHLMTGLFSAADPEFTMIRIDLSTSSTQVAAVDQYGMFGLIEVPGAGLFEMTGDSFRSLTDGSVRFYGERLIVVEECRAPGDCRRYWLDRATGNEIDRPVPEESSGWLLGPSGRIAITFNPGGRVFIDTETGQTLPDLVGSENGRGLTSPEDLTPDERFLAAVPSNDSGNVQIYDLLRGESWTIDLPRTFNLSKVLFVPKTEIGDDV